MIFPLGCLCASARTKTAAVGACCSRHYGDKRFAAPRALTNHAAPSLPIGAHNDGYVVRQATSTSGIASLTGWHEIVEPVIAGIVVEMIDDKSICRRSFAGTPHHDAAAPVTLVRPWPNVREQQDTMLRYMAGTVGERMVGQRQEPAPHKIGDRNRATYLRAARRTESATSLWFSARSRERQTTILALKDPVNHRISLAADRIYRDAYS